MISRILFKAIACLFSTVVLPVVAQPNALALTPQESQAEGLRLQARRAELERIYQQDMAVCYQQFDVTRCRNVARDKRIEANATLRKDELAYNARERRLAAEEAQRRSDDRLRQAQRNAQEAALPENALPTQSQRQSDITPQQRNGNNQRAAYEEKQREAADRRSRLEKRLRERDKPPAAPLPIPEAAK